MGVCGNVYSVATIVKDSEFFSLGVLKYVCVRGVMAVMTHGVVGARVWEV